MSRLMTSDRRGGRGERDCLDAVKIRVKIKCGIETDSATMTDTTACQRRWGPHTESVKAFERSWGALDKEELEVLPEAAQRLPGAVRMSLGEIAFRVEFWGYRVGTFLLLSLFDDPAWIAFMFC